MKRPESFGFIPGWQIIAFNCFVECGNLDELIGNLDHCYCFINYFVYCYLTNVCQLLSAMFAIVSAHAHTSHT